MQTVIGLYAQLDQAEEAVRELRSSGFTNDQVSVIARDSQRQGEEETGADPAARGAGIGATLGGIAGLLLGLGAVVLPGIGPVVAAGPVISTLAGAGLGAVGGSLTGALADWGVPEQHAAAYAEGIRRGETLVIVRAEQNQSMRAASVLNRYNPVDIAQRMDQEEKLTAEGAEFAEGRERGNTEGAGDVEEKERGTAEGAEFAENQDTESGDRAIQIVEKDGERPVSPLDTLIEGQTRQEDPDRPQELYPQSLRPQSLRPQSLRPPQEQEMDLRREQIVLEPVEHSPDAVEAAPQSTGLDGRENNAPWQPFEEGVVSFETVSEEPLIEKRTRIRETVQVVKEVRHERYPPEVHLDPEGELIQPEREQAGDILIVPTGGQPEPPPQQLTIGARSLEPDFRQHYDLTYRNRNRGNRGDGGDGEQLAYEQVLPAYAFGLELAASPRYGGYDWSQLEPPARQLWQQRYPGADWEPLRSAVRYAWNLGSEHRREEPQA